MHVQYLGRPNLSRNGLQSLHALLLRITVSTVLAVLEASIAAMPQGLIVATELLVRRQLQLQLALL